jgi:DNA-binding SARP family transcriptional activator
MATLNIQLLGKFRVVHGDTTITALYSRGVQSLFAWLVLHAGIPYPRAHLAFLFWPDSSESQARTNLRKAIHQLQQVLPDLDCFLASAGTVLYWRADAPYTLDVAEFEAAVRSAATPAAVAHAIALYRGDLLPSCYDDWIIPKRERLQQTFTNLLERGIVHFEASGDYATAIHYAQWLIDSPYAAQVNRSCATLSV